MNVSRPHPIRTQICYANFGMLVLNVMLGVLLIESFVNNGRREYVEISIFCYLHFLV